LTNTSGRDSLDTTPRSTELPFQLAGLGVSMLRFSWALTMFGAQQTVNLVTASASGQPRAAEQAFDAVTGAVEEQFGGVLRGAYRSGGDCLPGLGREKPEVAEPRG